MTSVTYADKTAARSHLAKRESVIDAAAGVFCQHGYGGANIDMIAASAGVSRQTIYNHHGDKDGLFRAVVREVTERINAGVFETLSTFPDRPGDLSSDLTAFATRLIRNCICNRDGKFLRKLLISEGERYPGLFAEWRENGPDRTVGALAARLARLALAGHLELDDPDLAARQFLALVNADLQTSLALGEHIADDRVVASAGAAVRTFLRAFGTCRGRPPTEG
jgi:AcrR family transcriptional regulator